MPVLLLARSMMGLITLLTGYKNHGSKLILPNLLEMDVG